MARKFLIALFGALLMDGAAQAATVDTTRTAFRNATVVGIDAQTRRIVADFGNGQATLEVENGIPLTSIALGDPIVLGVRSDGANTSRVVYLRRSMSAPPAPAARTAEPGAAVPVSTDGVRRPMHVVPNPQPRSRVKAVQPVETPLSLLENEPATLAYGGKVSAIVYTDTEPVAAPSAPATVQSPVAATSSLDAVRTDGAAQLETRLDTIDILARQADLSWNAFVRGCPGVGPADARGWLTTSAAVSGLSSGCESLQQRAMADADRVRQAMREAEGQARASWLTPGNVRDALRRRGLETAALR